MHRRRQSQLWQLSRIALPRRPRRSLLFPVQTRLSNSRARPRHWRRPSRSHRRQLRKTRLSRFRRPHRRALYRRVGPCPIRAYATDPSSLSRLSGRRRALLSGSTGPLRSARCSGNDHARSPAQRETRHDGEQYTGIGSGPGDGRRCKCDDGCPARRGAGPDPSVDRSRIACASAEL